MAVLSIFKHSLIISFFVFVMMLLVDFIDTASQRRMSSIIQGGRWRQYTLASFLGSTPGCLGAFMNVSFYAQGMIPFSVLFTTSFVQDGHGMLPMLSYNIKDSLLIKVFNLVFGIGVGGILFVVGL